ADGRIAEQNGRVRASTTEHDELHPQPHHVDARPEHPPEVEELRAPVEPVVMVHWNFDDAKTGILNLAHHLQADDAGILFQRYPIEDLAPQQPEIASTVPDAKPEQELDRVVGDACDDEGVA